MGQKINPIIFRLSNTNRWPCKYIEKKSINSSLYNYNDIEIRKFIIRFFNYYGLIVQNLKVSYFNNSLHIFVSYFTTLKVPFLITNSLKNQKIKLITKNKNVQKYKNERYNQIKSYSRYKELDYIKRCTNKNLNILQKEKQTLKLRRIKFLKYYKNYVLIKKHKCVNNIKNNYFLYKFFENISMFTNKQFNIHLITKPFSDLKPEFSPKNIKTLKKDLIKLRKYDQNEFFKEGINILFLCSTQKKSAKLLSYFIAFQLKKLKKHNFFLRFIKNVLVLFKNKIFSKLEGIRIKIKGRFNKAPRARSKILTIGNDIPILTLKSNIDYAETTSFTANGTFGVKVWICEKK